MVLLSASSFSYGMGLNQERAKAGMACELKVGKRGRCKSSTQRFNIICQRATVSYSQVHKYWDIDTILISLALYTTTMDLK